MKQIASSLGKSGQTVWRWEAGWYLPEVNTLNALADILHVSSEWLMGETDTLDTKTSDTPETLSKKVDVQPPVATMSFWGQVVDEARKIASSGSTATIKETLFMLQLSIEAVQSALKERGEI